LQKLSQQQTAFKYRLIGKDPRLHNEVDLNVFQKRRKCGLIKNEEAEWWKDYVRKNSIICTLGLILFSLPFKIH
jgi:hypothetical protein